MASVNKVILIGNLGADPETRYLPSGDAVTNIRVATSEKWKDKSGEQQEHTEWHRVAFFGKTAEIAGEGLKKGSPVYVEGRIRTRKWQSKEGQERYATRRRSSPTACNSWAGAARVAARSPWRGSPPQWPRSGNSKPQQQQKKGGGLRFRWTTTSRSRREGSRTRNCPPARG